MSEGGPPRYPYGFNLPPTQLIAGSAAPLNFPVSSAPPLYPAVPTAFSDNSYTSFSRIPSSFPGGAPTHFPAAPVTNLYPQGGHTEFISTQTHTSFPQSAPPQSPTWVPWRKGQMVPANAVKGGFDVDKSEIFVGRLKHNLDLLPAKVIPRKNVAYVPYNGMEISYDHCEILCHQNPCWSLSSNGQVPTGAIPVGRTGTGESLYAARVQHEGSMVVGKVHPSHGVCYIPFGGKEIGLKTYEVLIS